MKNKRLISTVAMLLTSMLFSLPVLANEKEVTTKQPQYQSVPVTINITEEMLRLDKYQHDTDNSENDYENLNWQVSPIDLKNNFANDDQCTAVQNNGDIFKAVLKIKSGVNQIDRTNPVVIRESAGYEESLPLELSIITFTQATPQSARQNMQIIDELPEPVRIEFECPPFDIQKYKVKDYKLIYEHNGNCYINNSLSYDDSTNTFSFWAQEFSTYEFFMTKAKRECEIHKGGVFNDVEWTDGDCTKGGYGTAICSECGEEYGKSFPGYAFHDYVNEHCSRCGIAKPVPPAPQPNSSTEIVYPTDNHFYEDTDSKNSNANEYIVTYYNLWAKATKTVKNGEKVPNVYVEYPGYTFLGWFYLQGAQWQKWNFGTVCNSNLELYALWQEGVAEVKTDTPNTEVPPSKEPSSDTSASAPNENEEPSELEENKSIEETEKTKRPAEKETTSNNERPSATTLNDKNDKKITQEELDRIAAEEQKKSEKDVKDGPVVTKDTMSKEAQEIADDLDKQNEGKKLKDEKSGNWILIIVLIVILILGLIWFFLIFLKKKEAGEDIYDDLDEISLDDIPDKTKE